MAHQMEATAATNASAQFIRSALLAAASLLMLAPTALFLPLTKRACGGGGGRGSVEAAERPAVEPDVSVLACLWPDSCCFEPMPTSGLRRENIHMQCSIARMHNCRLGSHMCRRLRLTRP